MFDFLVGFYSILDVELLEKSKKLTIIYPSHFVIGFPLYDFNIKDSTLWSLESIYKYYNGKTIYPKLLNLLVFDVLD